MRLSVVLIFLFLGTVACADPPLELVGIWHAVSATAPDGRDITPRGGLELEFTSDGVLVHTIVSSANSDGEPIRYRGHYTFEPPDKITYSYTRAGNEYTQHQRFRINEDIAIFENLDSGIITKLRRVQKSEFKPPKEISELPK